nr:MAG TPA: peptidase [Microviridae sp.]
MGIRKINAGKEEMRLTKMIKSYIIDTESEKQIGNHFKVKEFACKDGSPVVFIDRYLVSVLDTLRTEIGRPVIVTSGYRTPNWNKKAGGAKYSYHMRGMAADIKVYGMTPKEVAEKLDEIVPDECGIIVYNEWVHLDVRHNKYRKEE